MKDKAEYSIDLEKSQYAFLEEMAKAYDLPDVGKVVRCLVNYARDMAEQRDAIFADIRCLDC